MKKAIITGINGQDGYYLASFLLGKGYEVHGIHRPTSQPTLPHLVPLVEAGLKLHQIDITDSSALIKSLKDLHPDEVYNLAAQSHVGSSFNLPVYTIQADGIGAVNILEAIRTLNLPTRFFQASTSELYGNTETTPQNERTPLDPVSPYGHGKYVAHKAVELYRASHGIHASNGILFNHESEIRGVNFVTRKITRHLAQIAMGSQEPLEIGNLNIGRDWGYAGDYVEAFWRMLQQDQGGDFVLATGQTHTVRDVVETSARTLGLSITWQGEGVHEKGYDQDGRLIVQVNPDFFRPAEINRMVGDTTKARNVLGWEPRTTFEDMIARMTKSDLDQLRQEQKLQVPAPAIVHSVGSGHKRVLVTGATGQLGQAVQQTLAKDAQHTVISPSRAELDLLNHRDVLAYFAEAKPEIVFHLAAHIPGLRASSQEQLAAATNTMAMDSNVFAACLHGGTTRNVIYSGSVASYGERALQHKALSERAFHAGAVSISNRIYGASKLAALVGIEALRKEKIPSVYAILTNLYGHGGLAAHAPLVQNLMQRMHQAKAQHDDSLTVWGKPETRRDLLYANDAAEILVGLSQTGFNGLINVASGFNMTVGEIASTLRDTIGFMGEIKWEGTPGSDRPPFDLKLLNKTLPDRRITPFSQAVAQIYTSGLGS